jgi:ABC-type branched-subunit amino acid transport system permease subunit
VSDLVALGLLGLGIGGFYGLMALGVVIGHKGSGLVNIDQGARAMYPAYAFVTLRTDGTVFLPWFDFVPGPIDIPVEVRLWSGPAPEVVSLAGGLAMAALLGVAVQFLVFGPLRHKPPISKVIGSLGVLLYLQSIAVFHFGAQARDVEGVLPDGRVENVFGLGTDLPYDRITLAVIAVVLGAAAGIYYRTSRIGLATRAIEDSELGTSLLGYSASRIATWNWVLSTVVTGLAGILFLDVVSLTPSNYILLVVPALGAALAGNLTAPFVAAVAGVTLGVVQSAAAGLTIQSWWPDALPQAGVREAIPLLLIVAVQWFRGDALPIRSAKVEEAHPAAPRTGRTWVGATAFVIAVAWVATSASPLTEGKVITTLIAAVLMLSSVVLVGYLGQVSLANLAFAGVAAYLGTKFAADGQRYGLNPFVLEGPGLPAPLAALVGVALAVAAGLLVALPALRIRGIQLAVVTLAAAVAASDLILANEAILGPGARSNTSVPPPVWFGIDLAPSIDDQGLSNRTPLLIFCAIWLVVLALAVVGLRRGITGRRFLAVRANERSAAAVGIDITRAKLLGFGIASFIAGIAGVLIAYQQTILQVSSWSALGGIANLALLFLGGVGRLAGVVIGSLLAPGGVLSQSSSEGEILRQAVSGLLMIAMAVFRPDGLASLNPTRLIPSQLNPSRLRRVATRTTD